jgi:hypothetical protein
VSGDFPGAGSLARLFAPRSLRWSLVELCRRTTLEGWDELQAAAAAGCGVALIAPAGGSWPVAARAIAAWAGPLHLALPAGARDRRLARLACAGGAAAPRLAAGPDAVGTALAAGETVLFVVEGGSPEPSPPAVAGDLPRLAIAIEQPGRGRYRLVIQRGRPRPSP